MANNGLGKEAVQEITAVFNELNKALDVTADKLNVIRKGLKMPSNFVKEIEEGANAQNKANKANDDAIKKLKELERVQKNRVALDRQRQREIKKQETLLKKEAKEFSKVISKYNEAEKELKRLQKEYKELAIQKELNGKLDTKQAIQLGKVSAELSKYDAALKKVDAGMGQYRRSVGNYGKAFDSLGFSVAQITRESPAFLNSLNTGFMAISNNIPILVDEIGRAQREVVRLRAAGQATESVAVRLGKAIFSWQSLISAAIVALTVLGPKLFEWAFGMSEAEKATQEATKAIDEQNESLRKNIELRSRLVGNLRTQFEDANRFFELTNSEAGLQTLQELFDKIGANADVLTDQNILLEDRETIAKNLLEIEELKLENEKDALRVAEDNVEMAKFLNGESEKFKDSGMTSEQYAASLKTSYQDILDNQKEINRLNAENERIIGKTVVLEIERKKIAKETKELIDDSNRFMLDNSVASLGQQISTLKNLRDQLSRTRWEYAQWTQQIEELEDRLKDLKTIYNELNAQEKLNEKLIKGFKIDGGDGQGDDPLGWESYFNTLVPLVKSTFELISQAQRAATQQALSDLEKQKDLAIRFAGESAEARAEIEEQYERKRAEIQKRQAEAEKKQAIFSIALNTAQAVVAALKVPPAPNVVLASIAGALGAAQLAFAASQPIPEFAEGVRDFGGGLAIVGDGGRSEVVRTPDGKVFKTPSKDTLVNLPKGSDVFSSEDEFNQELTKMLNMSMISNSPLISKPELTKEDLSDVISRLEDTIRNKESIEIIEDERGKRVFKKRLNARTEILNNRRRIQGRGI